MEFVEFLDRELVRLTRFAGALVGNRQDAHDVLAELDVGKQWSRISELDHPTAYIRKVIVNRFLADRRKFYRRRTDVTNDDSRPDRVVDDWQQWRRTATCWIGCSANCRRGRAVVVLRHYLGLDDAAIAAELGGSVSSVRSNMSRALARLRVCPELLPTENR